MENLKFNANITFNGLNNSLEIDLGNNLFFDIDRSHDMYKKLIRLFPKYVIHNRVKLLVLKKLNINAISLIKDYRNIGLKEAKEIYDSEYRIIK